ncbi:hypothetical protein BCR37DRAFT_394239 [Protomyces lactucae-debilis]|uniref:DUF6697 domain-containing protein n=1 Tax=Protomyces lactucae-debilis TaxID=2754530 RepID=A0A1Y2F9D9_PROLT|nr:uncharacterized protein BCR37DRAFT_394239 [Protomyces lactucae-debilis]ORY79515.1 hypothetical protein BCR37DRAFT_394239 [Protomyces lactucae-debilis]
MVSPKQTQTTDICTATHEFSRRFLQNTLGGTGSRMVENYVAQTPLPDDPATWRTPILGGSSRRTSLAHTRGSNTAAPSQRHSRKQSVTSISMPGSSVFPSLATPKLDMSPLFHPATWRERRTAKQHALQDDQVEAFLETRPCYACIESGQQPLFMPGTGGGVMVIEQFPLDESIPVFLSKEDAYLYVGNYKFAESFNMSPAKWEELAYGSKLEFCHALLQSSSDVHSLQAAGLTGDWARDFELRADVRQEQVNRLMRLISSRDFDVQFAEATFQEFDAAFYDTLCRRSVRQSIVSTIEDRSTASDEALPSFPNEASRSRRSSKFSMRNVFRRSHESIPGASPNAFTKTPTPEHLFRQRLFSPSETEQTPRVCRTEPIGGVTPLSFSNLQQLGGTHKSRGPGLDGRVAVAAWEAAQHSYEGSAPDQGLGLGILGHDMSRTKDFRGIVTEPEVREERPGLQRTITNAESLLSYATYKSMMTEESACSDSFFDEDEELDEDRDGPTRLRQHFEEADSQLREDRLVQRLQQVAEHDSQKHMLQIVRAANGERVFVL